MHTTYASHIRLAFVNPARARLYGLENGFPELHVKRASECVMFGQMEYGDWTAYVVAAPSA